MTEGKEDNFSLIAGLGVSLPGIHSAHEFWCALCNESLELEDTRLQHVEAITSDEVELKSSGLGNHGKLFLGVISQTFADASLVADKTLRVQVYLTSRDLVKDDEAIDVSVALGLTHIEIIREENPAALIRKAGENLASNTCDVAIVAGTAYGKGVSVEKGRNTYAPFCRGGGPTIPADGAAALAFVSADYAERKGLSVRGRCYFAPLTAAAKADYVVVPALGEEKEDEKDLAFLTEHFPLAESGVPTRVLGTCHPLGLQVPGCEYLLGVTASVLSVGNQALPPLNHNGNFLKELLATDCFPAAVMRPWMRETGRMLAGVFDSVDCTFFLAVDDAFPPAVLSRPPVCGLARPHALLLFSGDSPATVADDIRQVIDSIAKGEELQAVSQGTMSALKRGDQVRVALIAPAERDLAVNKLKSVANDLEAGCLTGSSTEKGVFVSTAIPAATTHVCAVFSGTTFPGLVDSLLEHLLTDVCLFPELKPFLLKQETRGDVLGDGIPTSLMLLPPDTLPAARRSAMRDRFRIFSKEKMLEMEQRPHDPGECGLLGGAVITHTWQCWKTLQLLGVNPSTLAGQCFGEYPALCAGGFYDIDLVISKIWQCLDARVELGDYGESIFVVGDWESARENILRECPGFYEAIWVAPTALFAGGTKEGVDKAVDLIKKTPGIFCQRLPFAAIHTPVLKGLREYFSPLFDVLDSGTPTDIPVYHSIRQTPFPDDPEVVRQWLFDNFDKETNYWKTLVTIAEQHERMLFVQCGTGSVEYTVGDKLSAEKAVFVSLDVEDATPFHQTLELCANLFVERLSFQPEALFETIPSPLSGTRVVMELDCPTFPPRRGTVPGLMPLIDSLVAKDVDGWVVFDYTMSLDRSCFLKDHSILKLRDPERALDALPVMPFTFSMEMLAEAAAFLTPGRGLTGFQSVLASQWIKLEKIEQLLLHVRVRVDEASKDGERVAVKGEIRLNDRLMFSGTVLFGTHYSQRLHPRFSQPFPGKAVSGKDYEHYHDFTLFHGSALHTFKRFLATGDRAFAAMLHTLPSDMFMDRESGVLLTDPALLDGIAQSLGVFAMTDRRKAMPLEIGEIEFYAPPVQPGVDLPMVAEVVDNRNDQVLSFDVEVRNGDGGVWLRARDWKCVLLPDRAEIHRLIMGAQDIKLAEILPSERADVIIGWISDFPALLSGTKAEWLRQVVLTEEDKKHAPDENALPKRQLDWLAGRVVAKDVCQRYFEKKADDIPDLLDISIKVSSAGAPYFELPAGYDDKLFLSISHSGGAVVGVCSAKPVGVDIEPVTRECEFPRNTRPEIVDERMWMSLADSAGAPANLFLWTGIEAASKCARTGLGGKPAAWKVEVTGPDEMKITSPENAVFVCVFQVMAGFLIATAHLYE